MKTTAILALAVVALMIAPARADKPKGYTVTLSDGKIGTTPVDSGDYRLLLHRDDMKVQLLNFKSGNVIDLDAKVESTDAKYDRTEVHSETINGVRQVTEIRLGGTKFRINFHQPS